MSKRILAVYYTQSGQLKEILDNFLLPFEKSDHQIEILKVEPVNDFPFPWTSKKFFDAMPESVLVKPSELKPFELKSDKYELIIVAYQPWFLSPSIPVNSILQHPDFINLIENTAVITLIGARNMWLNSQEKVKKLITKEGGQLVGNIVLVDKHNNLASAVSILHWMLGGKKDRYLGIFPVPGVSEKDIRDSSVFGQVALEHFNTDNLPGLQKEIISCGGVEVKANLMFIEGRAGKLFSIWAKFISNRKNKTFWLIIFKYYLLFALFIVAPVVLLINNLLFKPFLGKSVQKKKEYYLGVG